MYLSQCRLYVCLQFELREQSNEASVCLVSFGSQFLAKLEFLTDFSFDCCGVKIRWISVRSWSCKKNERKYLGAEK